MGTKIIIDDNGYEREEPEHSNLIHRKKAYKNIYLKNRDLYPLPFSKYVVHHIDGNKRNNKISNLQLMTKEQHNNHHGVGNQTTFSDDEEEEWYTPEGHAIKKKVMNNYKKKGNTSLILAFVFTVLAVASSTNPHLDTLTTLFGVLAFLLFFITGTQSN